MASGSVQAESESKIVNMRAGYCSGDDGGVLLFLAPAFALDAPVPDQPRGLKQQGFELSFELPEGATLLLSQDGGLPTQAHDGSIWIDHSQVVRAQAELDGELSEVVTHTYLFLEDVMEQPELDPDITGDAVYAARMRSSLETLPSVSLALDGDLSTTEQGLSFEYFEPETEPGAQDLQADCGGRRVGGHSIGYPKNNLRLHFRSEYGEGRLEADFFGEDHRGLPPIQSHDSLDLRGGSHDSGFYLGTRGQHLRNVWMDESELAMGHEAPHSRFVHVYLNAEYIGLYQLRERFDAAFLSEHRGGSEDDFEAVNGGRAVDGSGAAWSQVAAGASDFEQFREWVDVEQYLDTWCSTSTRRTPGTGTPTRTGWRQARGRPRRAGSSTAATATSASTTAPTPGCWTAPARPTASAACWPRGTPTSRWRSWTPSTGTCETRAR